MDYSLSKLYNTISRWFGVIFQTISPNIVDRINGADETDTADVDNKIDEGGGEMAYITDGRLVPNFSLAEMTNTKASETVKLVLTPEVVEHAQMMQELRDTYGKALNVSSWYRTASYNKKIGGASNSAHLNGRATDINNINTKDNTLVQQFVNWWKAICAVHKKVGGIEVYSWGMHFDSYSDKFGYKTFRYKDNR